MIDQNSACASYLVILKKFISKIVTEQVRPVQLTVHDLAFNHTAHTRIVICSG